MSRRVGVRRPEGQGGPSTGPSRPGEWARRAALASDCLFHSSTWFWSIPGSAVKGDAEGQRGLSSQPPDRPGTEEWHPTWKLGPCKLRVADFSWKEPEIAGVPLGSHTIQASRSFVEGSSVFLRSLPWPPLSLCAAEWARLDLIPGRGTIQV